MRRAEGVQWIPDDHFEEMPCDKRVQFALLTYPDGRRLPSRALRGCFGGSLAERREGSENWPPMAWMYSVATGQADAEELLPYFAGEGGWGLGGGEGQSLIYGVWPWVAALLVYPKLEGEVRDACRAWLRAVVTRLALSARTEAPATLKFRFGTQDYTTSRRGRDDLPAKARGLFVHAPGERSATLDGWWIRNSHLHSFLSSALGVEHEPRRPIPAPHYPYPEPPASDWPVSLANWVLGGRFVASSPGPKWALAKNERRLLLRFISEPSPVHAAPLLEWLSPYSNLGGVVSSWRYFDSGAMVAVSSRSTNHVKPGQGSILLAAVRGDGNLAWREGAVTPEDSRRQSFAQLTDTAVRLAASDGTELEFPLQRFGRLRFSIEHRENGVFLEEA